MSKARQVGQALELSRELLVKVVEKLRRRGIRAEVVRDPLGKYDVYIDIVDLDKLDRLCDEKELDPEVESLLC